MTHAQVVDVAESLGRPISSFSAEEVTQIQTWLTRVEGRLLTRIPDLDTRVLVESYVTAVRGVEVDVVIRRLNNPEGLKSEQIDDYRRERVDTAARADLWPTDDEWAELLPVSVVSRGAFSVTPRLSS